MSAAIAGGSDAAALLVKAAAKATRKGDACGAATLWLAAGVRRVEAGDRSGAKEAFALAEELGREAEALEIAAEAAIERAMIALDAEEISEAITALAWALGSGGLSVDDHARRAYVLHNLAAARAFLDAHKAAAELFGRAVAAWRSGPDASGLAESLLGLGESLVLHGEPTDGAVALEEALALLEARDRRDVGLEAAAYELLARARYRAGARTQALDPLRNAQQRWSELASRPDIARTTLGLAESLLELSNATQDEQGAAWGTEGLAVLRTWISQVKKEGDKGGVAYGWWRLAQGLARRQQRREAVDALIEAANLTTGTAHESLLARAAELEVSAVSAAGDAARPGGLDRAVRLFEKVGDDDGAAWCRRQQLHAMVASGQFEGAAQVIRSIRASESLSDDEDTALTAHLAWVYASADRGADAAACARKVIASLEPDSTLGRVLERFVEALASERNMEGT